MISDREEFLESEIENVERLLRVRSTQLQEAYDTIAFLQNILGKAAQIAGHIPYLCLSIDGSADLENAAMQLQQILIRRNL